MFLWIESVLDISIGFDSFKQIYLFIFFHKHSELQILPQYFIRNVTFCDHSKSDIPFTLL